jgi:hypothetical protein
VSPTFQFWDPQNAFDKDVCTFVILQFLSYGAKLVIEVMMIFVLGN